MKALYQCAKDCSKFTIEQKIIICFEPIVFCVFNLLAATKS